MKTILFKFLAFGFALIFALNSAPPTFAHGGDPRLEISAERLNPGSVLDIRGVDFEFEEDISLALISSQAAIPLGALTADADGVFLFTVTLPADLAEGIYNIRATTDDHVVDSPQITVSGSAILEAEEVGRLDEGEGYSLLAPMPTVALGAVPATFGAPVQVTTPSKTKGSGINISLLFVIVVALGLGTVFLIVQKRRNQ